MIRIIFRAVKTILNNYFLNHSSKAIMALPYNGALSLVDLGAAGEVEPRWRPFTQFLNYVGFEPDERSRNAISNNEYHFKTYQILPYALAADKRSANFNLCRKPQVSSLYEPKVDFLVRFLNAERFDIKEKLSIDCVSLDSIGVSDIDFLKIDIQGAEDDVLQGASTGLSSTLGLELEVEFIELYKDQPLFGDVCKTLSQYDLEFIDFVNLARWERNAFNGYGQCVFGDALFLKSPESMILQSLDVKKWSAYFSILIIYRRFDLVDVALKKLPDDFRFEFEKFGVLFCKAKNRDDKVKKIHRLLDRLFSFLGSTYRLHLLR